MYASDFTDRYTFQLLSEMDIVMPLDLMLSMLTGAARRVTEIERMADVDARLNASVSKQGVAPPSIEKTEHHRVSIARTVLIVFT